MTSGAGKGQRQGGQRIEPGVALYIHIPFCLRKCYYCDFNSYPTGAFAPETIEEYAAALIGEIRWYGARLVRGGVRPRAGSVYIGGGTPTVLATGQLQAILEACREEFPRERGEAGEATRVDGARRASDLTEVTVEANPGTLTPEKLEGLLSAGANRLSLGAQSLSDPLLAAIGRIHSAGDFIANYQLARQIGFANINVDLIFGLPGQTLAEWEETLKRVVALSPEHISAYGLSIEEGTSFARWMSEGKLKPAGEELEAAMFEAAMTTLEASGYEHYEISNYARPGFRSRHNQVYWRNEPYLGVGAGAWGYLEGVRYANVSRPGEYLERMSGERRGFGAQYAYGAQHEGFFSNAVTEAEQPSLPVQMGETMMMGLRLLEGVSSQRFRERFGRELLEVYPKEVEALEREGLLSVSAEGVRLTRRGLLLANRVFAAFLP